ncbi:MAG: hypothetical protein GX963_09120 [Bacteroidales bacterium]|nr:hypothetical protein [Bacteroidales bacterium]
MELNIDFHLKRGYFIYTSQKESFVTVVDYNLNGEVNRERPISKKEIEFINRVTTKETRESIIVDKKSTHRLISFRSNPFELVWKVNAKKRVLIGSDGKVEVDVPKMIFHVRHTDLMVYFYKVIKGKDMITPCTYPNVFTNYVCLGNVKVKNRMHLLSDEMDRWESYFFDTKFTGNNFTVNKNLKYIEAPWI